MKCASNRKTLLFPAGFSLIELLAVIVIIAIIGSLAVPSFSKIVKSSEVTQAGQMVLDQLNLTRLKAITRGRNYEIRFYKYDPKEIPGTNTPNYRAFLVFEQMEDLTYRPVTRLFKLPPSIIIDTGVAKDAKSLTTINFPSFPSSDPPREQDGATELSVDKTQILGAMKGTSYKYTPITFRPSGSTSLNKDLTWILTVRPALPNDPGSQTDLSKVPNFITIQIDPYTGVARYFRP